MHTRIRIYREDIFGPIKPDRYYIWTWIPKGKNTAMTDKMLYRKHLTNTPFFSKRQAILNIKIIFGPNALKYIHFISGKALIRKGIREIYQVNGASKYDNCAWMKRRGKWRKFHIPQFVIATEYLYPAYRKGEFKMRLFRRYLSKGRKSFTQYYYLKLYGYSRRIKKWYFKRKRREIYFLMLQKLRENAQQREGNL